jgi:hypothetical protein
MLSSLIILVTLALVGPACTSLHAELPASRFESPEVNGTGRRFNLSTNISAAHDDVVTPDASARPPDFNQPQLKDDTLLGLAGSFGLVNRLDIGVRSTFGPSPTMFVVKYQILGPTRSEAKKDDVSLAITASAGGGKSTKAGDQSGTFGPGGHNWNGTTEVLTTDVALILGQRLSDRLLVYGGGFYSNYKINSTIDQDPSSDGSSPAASYSQTHGGYQMGANVGLEFNFGIGYLMGEVVYSDVRASNLGHSLLRAGGAIGLNF